MLEPLSAEGDSKFARALGSVDGRTREAGLQALAVWLSRRQEVDRLDLLKLWKGLFYTFWHSDQPTAQVCEPRRARVAAVPACMRHGMPCIPSLHCPCQCLTPPNARMLAVSSGGEAGRPPPSPPTPGEKMCSQQRDK